MSRSLVINKLNCRSYSCGEILVKKNPATAVAEAGYYTGISPAQKG